jgi:hypothetical protein
MAVTDEHYDVLRERDHEVETRTRGQMDLTAYMLGRLGSIDESLVAHTKLLVELSQRQGATEQRQDRLEKLTQEIMAKLDALPAALAALIKPAND